MQEVQGRKKMAFPPKMALTGLGGPPASPVIPKAPIKKVAKKKPTNKANKFAKALTKGAKSVVPDSEYY